MMRCRSGEWTKWASVGSFVLAAVLALCGACAGIVAAEEPGPGLTVSGDVEYGLGVSLRGDGVTSNMAGYHLSLSTGFERTGWLPSGNAYISLKGSYDLQNESGRLADLDEAYVDLYFTGADLRLGQQAVSWGTAYGFNPTSYVNPVPNPVSGAGGVSLAGVIGSNGLEPKGLAVPAASATLYPSWGEVGLVAVVNPRLQGVPVPGDTQAAILLGAAEIVGEELEPSCPDIQVAPSSLRFSVEPPESLSDRLEYAARVGARIGRWDLYLSGYRGWEDYPVLWVTSTLLPPSQATVDPNAAYRKETKAGLAVSCTWGPYTLWGEGSYAWPDKVAGLDDSGTTVFSLSSNDPHWQAVVGADRSFGDSNDVYVMAEYIYNSSGSILTPYQFTPGEREAKQYLAGAARWQPGQDHKFELSAVYCVNDQSYVVVPRYTYQVDESTSVWFGLAVPGGAADSEFGTFSDGRSANLGVKLAF